MPQSTSSRARRKDSKKPEKPYKDFPLTPHASGKWMKKMRGKIHYFGAWATRVNEKLVPVDGDGAKEAEAEYAEVRDDLHACRTPRVGDGGLLVKHLCESFLQAKKRKVEVAELCTNLFADYKIITDLIVDHFGGNRLVDDLTANDFAGLRVAMAKRWGPVRLANSITRVKSVFKYGLDNGLMERVVRYGSEFVKPDNRVLRKHRAAKPVKMFEADELRALIDGMLAVGDAGPELVKPDPSLRAMILLGVNCGFGNTDCAALSFTGLDLAGGWADFPRPKTGIARRCPLWPETVAALKAVADVRPKSAASPDCGRVFLTRNGTPLVVQTAKGNKKDRVGVLFTRLLRATGLHRKGIGFYSLRHVFETVAGGSKDQVVVDLIMGHADPSMAGAYRERVEDARLRAVVDHVRAWLWKNPV